MMRRSETIPEQEKPVRGELISITKAAKKTGLGKDWFYYHMKNETLPFPWFPLTAGKRFMDSADIDDWLRLRKVPAAKGLRDIEGVVPMRK
jgi:predicted DNA-binding transcriptional regulator AlpA